MLLAEVLYVAGTVLDGASGGWRGGLPGEGVEVKVGELFLLRQVLREGGLARAGVSKYENAVGQVHGLFVLFEWFFLFSGLALLRQFYLGFALQLFEIVGDDLLLG